MAAFSLPTVTSGADTDFYLPSFGVFPLSSGLHAITTLSGGYLFGARLGGPTPALERAGLANPTLAVVDAMKQLELSAGFKSRVSTCRVAAERGAACCTAVSPQMISEQGPQGAEGWKTSV